MKKLERTFYLDDAIEVSKKILGKNLVHIKNGIKTSGRIVEVEAYMGVNDKAAHSYGGRRTERNEITYGIGGFAYVFFIYGMYYCMNVTAGNEDVPQVVLIRALEPVCGMEAMAERRYKKTYEELTQKQIIALTNGPSKLCMAMGIDREDNGKDLCGEEIYVEDSETSAFEIVETTRIGIDYAEEAVEFPWRYYIKNSKYVSKYIKDK